MASRVGEAARFYARRGWRWWRVVSESRPGTARPAAGQRRVLVVRLDAIGDFVLWSGAARALREWLGPDTHVTLAANAMWADVARTQGIADEIWPVAWPALRWNGAYRDALRARVSGAGFSMAINPRHAREMMQGDSVIRWSRATERIGLVGDDVLLPPSERRWADGWYTTLHPTARPDMHELERHVEFLRALGATVDGVPQPRLDVSALGVEAAGEPSSAGDAGAAIAAPYFVVSPGASAAAHRWPVSRYAELARAVQRRTGWRAVVVGSAKERELAASVADGVPGALNLAGNTSVARLIQLIHGSRLVLSNDTAAVHIAAATGAHAICLAGGWHWERFVPYLASLGPVAQRVHAVSMVEEMPCFRCRGYCSVPHRTGDPRPCVDRITVERALATVDHVLSLPDLHADG